MTSKEALDYVINEIDISIAEHHQPFTKTRKLLDVIAKDIEVLEILKENCVDISLLKELTESYPLEQARCKYNHEYAHTSYLDDRAFQLIKEWLEK